ncbi:MAG: hydrogenase maturation nickel metallochaperone HypA [Nitrospiraceae bacterium]|nr:hydrogenase maturation nickel metallochaperone HypA [Nitrospiraceae bacterium]
MHEAGIAMSIIETAAAHLEKSGYGKVDSVSVRIGAASGVVPECLRFAFNAARAGTPLENAELLIEEVHVKGLCPACGKSFITEEKYFLSCPGCGQPGVRMVAGRELDIMEIEVS